MKKFISMVMAAAMVVSLVPATAFAAEPSAKVTGKVVETVEKTEVLPYHTLGKFKWQQLNQELFCVMIPLQIGSQIALLFY